jgi:hypothetical protein
MAGDHENWTWTSLHNLKFGRKVISFIVLNLKVCINFVALIDKFCGKQKIASL